MKRDKAEYSIQAVENAIEVLEQFMSSKGELGITEISRNLGLHKNNIFRLLATLESKGYIEQNRNTEHYKLGIKVLELGRAFLKHTGLVKVATPILEELTNEVNENSYLGLMKENQVFYVEHAESTQVLRVASRIGTRLSPLCTAIGKVLLAYYDEDERTKVMSANKFVKHTEKTILEKGIFLKQLDQVQLNGYAIDDQELDTGVTCVSGPIFNYNNRIVAGISLSGPCSRFTPEALQEKFIPKVREYSQKISRAIGYTGE